MSDIKLIALDMDGTLLNTADEMTAYTKEVIGKALDQGVYVVLSTGRALQSCYPYAEALGLESYLVTVNGGEIWTMEQELVERHLMAPNVVEDIYQLALQKELETWMITTEKIYFNERPEDFHAHEWLKLGGHTLDEAALESFIQEVSYIEGLELTNSLPINIEINPKGVSKASALHRVCRELGITMDEVMAVGDSLNDMKMIQEAGLGVAMKNGQEAIKKAADYMTDTNNQDGVAKVIEKFVLNS